jgi:hypothetical protein
MSQNLTSTEASPVKPLSPSSPENWRHAPSSSSDTDKSESSKSAKSKAAGGHKKHDEDRRARHRAVQRRFVQRKKVREPNYLMVELQSLTGLAAGVISHVGSVPAYQAPRAGTRGQVQVPAHHRGGAQFAQRTGGARDAVHSLSGRTTNGSAGGRESYLRLPTCRRTDSSMNHVLSDLWLS